MQISFLSDYGLEDEFVGVVHSVIRSISNVEIIDITHNVKPFDIRAGSLALVRSVGYLNPGIVLAVVDPGVGTSRRSVAVEVGEGESIFVGPDNGLLAPAVAMVGGARRTFQLDKPEYHLDNKSNTFDGRDVFAPVAAHLANGIAVEKVGSEIDPLSLLPGVLPLSQVSDDQIKAEVLWVDRYGNLQLNVDPNDLQSFGENIQISVGTSNQSRNSENSSSQGLSISRQKLVEPNEFRSARRVDTFGQLNNSELGIISDSYGMATICLANSSASDMLKIGEGGTITISRLV